jgi:hypothetical protein
MYKHTYTRTHTHMYTHTHVYTHTHTHTHVYTHTHIHTYSPSPYLPLSGLHTLKSSDFKREKMLYYHFLKHMPNFSLQEKTHNETR